MIALACIGFAAAIPNMTAATADVLPANGRGMGFAVLTLPGHPRRLRRPAADRRRLDPAGRHLRPGQGRLAQYAMLILLPPVFICIGMAARIRHTYDDDAAKALAATWFRPGGMVRHMQAPANGGITLCVTDYPGQRDPQRKRPRPRNSGGSFEPVRPSGGRSRRPGRAGTGVPAGTKAQCRSPGQSTSASASKDCSGEVVVHR